MRLGSDEEGPEEATSAYPSFFALSTRHKRIFMVVLVVALFLLLRSHVQRDYRADAEKYLRSVGREDALESIMPNKESVTPKKRSELLPEAPLAPEFKLWQLQLEKRVGRLEARLNASTSA